MGFNSRFKGLITNVILRALTNTKFLTNLSLAVTCFQILLPSSCSMYLILMEDHVNWQGNCRLFENTCLHLRPQLIDIYVCFGLFVGLRAMFVYRRPQRILNSGGKEKEWRKFLVLFVLAFYVKLLITSSKICYIHVYPWSETLSQDNFPSVCVVLYYIPVIPVFGTK